MDYMWFHRHPNDVMEQELANVKALLNKRTLQLQKMTAERNAIKAKLSVMEENVEIHEKEQELSCLARELTVVLKQKMSLKGQLEDSRSILSERQSSVEEFSQSELSEARETISPVGFVKSELTEEKVALGTNYKQMEELAAQMKQLKKEVDAKTAFCSSFEDSINSMKKQIEELLRREENVDTKTQAMESLKLANQRLLEEKKMMQNAVKKLGKYWEDYEENEQILTATIHEHELKRRESQHMSTSRSQDSLKLGERENDSHSTPSKSDVVDSDYEFLSARSSPTKQDKLDEATTDDDSFLRASSSPLGPSFYRRVAPEYPNQMNKRANDSVCRQQ